MVLQEASSRQVTALRYGLNCECLWDCCSAACPGASEPISGQRDETTEVAPAPPSDLQGLSSAPFASPALSPREGTRKMA